MKKSFPRKLAAFLIISLVAVFAALPAVIWVGSSGVLFPRRRTMEQRHWDVRNSPADYGITLESFSAKTHDDHELKGFLVYPSSDLTKGQRSGRMLKRMQRAGISRLEKPRGTVILLHGRSGLKDNMLTVAQRFVAADFRCIVFDARAHGESGGKFCTFGKLERKDVSAVLDHVTKMIEPRGEELGPVLGFGNSLGAAVLLQAMPEERRIVGATSVAAFADSREQVFQSMSRVTRGYLPKPLKRGIFDVGIVARRIQGSGSSTRRIGGID